MQPAIEICGVSKAFGSVRALIDISLDIPEGEFFALLGPNGAGKTTLISILAGLARADAGTLKVMGHDVVTDYRGARRSLGVVPQELVFDPFFTVRETLQFQSGYFGLNRNDDWIDEVMATETTLDERKRQMSKAEERLARAEGLLADVRSSLEAIQGQKAIIDQAVEKAGSLPFLLKQAEAAIQTLRDERKTTDYVRSAVATLRDEDIDEDYDEDVEAKAA